MNKLSLSLLMFFGFLAFSTLQAQTATKVKGEKTNCQRPCTKSAQAVTYPFYFSAFAVAANEEKASTPSSMTAKEKANCQKICAKTVAVNGKCDPKDCLLSHKTILT
jgi:hypothetical protein